jgi:hypothetical protein
MLGVEDGAASVAVAAWVGGSTVELMLAGALVDAFCVKPSPAVDVGWTEVAPGPEVSTPAVRMTTSRVKRAIGMFLRRFFIKSQ